MSSSQDAGNAAAIREALKVADETANELLSWCSNHYQELNCMGGRLKRALESAANAPWRNCDRFGGDNALLQKAYLSECGGNYNPLDANSRQAYLVGYGNWLLAPAKKGTAK